MTIENKLIEAAFILVGEEGLESVKGVEPIRYMRRLLHRSVDVWLEVLNNSWKARQVWGILGKLLRREGADPFVLEMFYHEVVQAMFIFGAQTWGLTVEISQKLKGVHVGFLRQVTRKKTQRLGGDSWQKVPVDIVLHASSQDLH